MARIPEQVQLTPEQAFEQLQVWFTLRQQLQKLKQTEVLARKDMVAFYFHNPVEGTNRVDLGGGFELKLTYGYDRKVDEAALQNVTAEQVKKLKLPMDELIRWKPELSVTAYRALNAEQQKFVDGLLDIKEGSPQLEIVPTANTAGAAKHKAAAEAAAQDVPLKFNINSGKEDDTEAGQYYKDGDGVWWLLGQDGDDLEWAQIEEPAQIEELEAQLKASKPKRTRRKKGEGA
jgi:hypothetical protein